MSALVDQVEALYEAVVTDPHPWTDASFEEWVNGLATEATLSRTAARSVRRCLRIAQRLNDFWAVDARSTDPSIGWRSRVDIAQGPKAWRPVLDLALEDLDANPSAAAFDRVGVLFAVVNNTPFLDGVGYDAWLAERAANESVG